MSLSNSTGNLLDAFTGVFKSRVSSKFGGAFFVSWLVFNWEFMYYLLFSEHTVEHKLTQIEVRFLTWSDVLLCPFLAAIVYLLVFPLLSEISEFCWNAIQQYVKRKGSMILEGKIPLNEEDKSRIYKMIRETETKHRAVVAEKDKEIATLQAIIVDETGSAKWENKEQVKEQNEEEAELPLSVDAYSDIVRPILQSDDGRYLLTNWLAAEFNLDKDNSVHKLELNEIYTVYESILLALPEPWRPKDLKSAIALDNRVFNKDKTNAVALKFEAKGLLKLNSKSGSLVYSMNNKSLGVLEEIYLNLQKGK